METPDHRATQRDAGAYVIGALDDAERVAFEAHMAGCDECAAEVRAFRRVATALARSASAGPLPVELRSRILRSTGGAAAPGKAGAPRVSRAWLPLAAMVAVAAGLSLFASDLQRRVAMLEAELARVSARAEAADRLEAEAREVSGTLQSLMAVFAAPDLVRIDLQGQQPAPDATGRALWSRARGMVFTSSSLPSLPPGRVYQVWVVTAPGPISAGLLDADSAASGTAFFATPPDIPAPAAVAVTVEPAGGVPAPTGQPYLVGSPAPVS